MWTLPPNKTFDHHKKKIPQLKKNMVLVLLSTHVKRVSVSRMRDFFCSSGWCSFDKVILNWSYHMSHRHINITNALSLWLYLQCHICVGKYYLCPLCPLFTSNLLSTTCQKSTYSRNKTYITKVYCEIKPDKYIF